MKRKAVPARQEEIRVPQRSFCAEVNHRLSCISDHACKAVVVDVFGQKASLAGSRRASSETPRPIKVQFKYLMGFCQHLVISIWL